MNSTNLRMPARYTDIQADEMVYLDGGITIEKDNFWPALLSGLSITVTIGWKGTGVDEAFGLSSKITNDSLKRAVRALFNYLTLNYTIKLV